MAEMNCITKICIACKEEKKVFEFNKQKNAKDGLYPYCKKCNKIKSRLYYENNKEKAILTSKIWKSQNKEKVQECNRKYAENNQEKIKEKNRIYGQSENGRAVKREYARNYEHNYRTERAKEDEVFDFKIKARLMLRSIFKRKGYTKRSKSNDILGCSWQELKLHIESQFVDGMSWENRSAWHIDHIIP